MVPEDYHNDCDSSSSVVADDGDFIASSSFHKAPLPFDLNFPPSDVNGELGSGMDAGASSGMDAGAGSGERREG